MWKKIEPYLSLTIAGLSLILTCDWYLDGREKEALAGLVVVIGAFIYCFKNQIWPEEKETTVQIEQIIGDVKDYQSLEKDIETLKIAFENTPVENHKVRLHFSLALNEKEQIKANLKRAIEQAEKYVSRLDIKTGRLDHAKALFQKGDILGALKILEDELINADSQVVKQAKQNQEERLNEIAEKAKGIAEEWKMKAMLMSTQYSDVDWFEKTKMYFQNSLDLSVSNDTVLEYGTFLFHHNDIKGAIFLFESQFGKDYSKLKYLDNFDEFSMARIENNIANVYLKVKDFSKARLFALKSLERVSVLANSSPDKYLSIKTEAISLVAIISQASRDFTEAEKLYLEALVTARSLSNSNMELKLGIEAKILNTLAIVRKEKLKYDDAIINYNDAIRKYKLLSKKYPDKYLSALSLTQVNLANLYSNLKQSYKAKELYLKSIELDRVLSKQNPQAYSLNLANSLYNLAILYQQLGNYADADTYFEESIEIVRLFVNENPDSFNHMLSIFLNGYASCSYKSKNYELAQNLYEEAIDIVSSISKKIKMYLKDFADLKNNIALLFRELERIKEAESLFLEASSNYESLLLENFEFISLPYAKNLKNLAELYFAYIPNHNKALQFAEKSLKLYIAYLNSVPEAKENYETLLKIIAYSGEDVDIFMKGIQNASDE